MSPHDNVLVIMDPSTLMHTKDHPQSFDCLQSGIPNGKVDVFEVKEIAAKDMKIILYFIYGVLDAIPMDQLQSLVLATHRLQVEPLPTWRW